VSEITAEDVARVASSFAKQELEVGARLERERIIQVLLNNTSEIKLMLNGEIIRLDAWDKTPKFAEQTLRQLFEGENK